jgi:hypothetical protein
MLTPCFFVQINAINAATEAACLILSVDETVKNPKVRVVSNVYCTLVKPHKLIFICQFTLIIIGLHMVQLVIIIGLHMVQLVALS